MGSRVSNWAVTAVSITPPNFHQLVLPLFGNGGKPCHCQNVVPLKAQVPGRYCWAGIVFHHPPGQARGIDGIHRLTLR